jgi:hypothetical protein
MFARFKKFTRRIATRLGLIRTRRVFVAGYGSMEPRDIITPPTLTGLAKVAAYVGVGGLVVAALVSPLTAVAALATTVTFLYHLAATIAWCGIVMLMATAFTSVFV